MVVGKQHPLVADFVQQLASNIDYKTGLSTLINKVEWDFSGMVKGWVHADVVWSTEAFKTALQT